MLNILRLKKYKGVGIQMNKTEYEKAIKHPVKSEAPVYFLTNAVIPVLLKRVKTEMGTCFFLHTEELATIEQEYQGRNRHKKRTLKHTIFENKILTNTLSINRFSKCL